MLNSRKRFFLTSFIASFGMSYLSMANPCYHVKDITLETKTHTHEVSTCGVLDETILTSNSLLEITYLGENEKEILVKVTHSVPHYFNDCDLNLDPTILVSDELYEATVEAKKYISLKNDQPFSQILFCPEKNDGQQYFEFLPH